MSETPSDWTASGDEPLYVFKGLSAKLQGYEGYQFGFNKRYSLAEGLEAAPCYRGFHGARDPRDVFKYYSPAQSSRYIIAKLWRVVHGANKCSGAVLEIGGPETELPLGQMISICGTFATTAGLVTLKNGDPVV